MHCRNCNRTIEILTSDSTKPAGTKTIAIHHGDDKPDGYVEVDRMVSISYKRALRRRLEAICRNDNGVRVSEA
jgi:hypothetical protein